MTRINTEKELMLLCARNKDGSFSTQAARRDILSQAARQLVELGFYNLHPSNIKQKHVQKLLEKWQSDKLSNSTLKNRMAALRWVAEKISKQNLIPRSNVEVGIGKRRYVTNVSKSVQLSDDALQRIKDERVRMSLELQSAFGLRREESIKFQPKFAMASGTDKIILKASWTKGGRPREIPITNAYQRDVLARALVLAGEGSLIPKADSYKVQLKKYENETNRAGLSKLHGLRHDYAQRRYESLTGWKAPACGGPRWKQLTAEQKEIDQSVRLKISEELGHSRINVTSIYLGK